MSPTGDEFELIDWLRGRAASDDRVVVGIGDDAAVLRPAASHSVLAVDMLIEGRHFTIPPATPEQIGRKALAVNLSDLAAMAARPVAACMAVALPSSRGLAFARDLHAGLLDLADEFGVALIGGDTNTWSGPLVVSVTVLGECGSQGCVRRTGARIGDRILVTGELGGSLEGKHLTFTPRVAEALRLSEAVELHAMIDVSDGLAADLFHILDESGVGAVLDARAIPVSPAAASAGDDRSPLEHALADGEDFELLFTCSPDDARRLVSNPPVEVRLSDIGEIVKDVGAWLVAEDGTRRPLARTGWTHRFDA